MDLILILVILLLIVVGGTICIEIYSHFSESGRKLRQFSGPEPKPVIGNLLDIITSPEAIFKKLRRYALSYYPCYALWSTSAFTAVNIVGPDDMQLVLSNFAHHQKSDIYMLLAEWLGDGLLISSGDKWQHRRKILTPTFHFNILKQFIPIFNKCSNKFCEDLSGEVKKDINIMPHIHKCSLNTIAETAMGTVLSYDKGEVKYRKAINRMGEIIVHRVMRPWFYFRVLHLFYKDFYEERFLLRYLKKFTKSVIDERELNFNQSIVDNAYDDHLEIGTKKRLAMLDLLISAKRNNEINYAGVLEEVDTFMFEGHDTISMAIAFCLMLLACNKDAQDKAYNELESIFDDSKRDATYEDLNYMNYLEMVIKESLRLYPSVPLVSRVTGEDIVTSNGLIIPNGTRLLLHIYDTHHHPSLYPDPEKFDPERFLPENTKNRHPFAYLPFSAGSRNCIGQKYAILSLKTTISAILRNYELIPVDTPDTITLITDIILRTKEPIRVQLRPRSKTT